MTDRFGRASSNGGVAGVLRRPSRPRPPERPVAGKRGSPEALRPPFAIIRIAFVLFVASIPFESFELGLGQASPSRLLGWLLCAVAVLQPDVCFRRPPHAYWWFAAFFAVFLVNGRVRGSLFEAGVVPLTQLFVLLWLSSNLLRYERIFYATLYTFVASCVGVALLELSGLTPNAHAVRGRMSALEEDPNSLGTVLALGLLTIIGISYGRRRGGRVAKAIVWFCFAMLSLGVVRTGSRGAFVALAAGIAVLVFREGPAWLRARNAAIAAIALIVLIVLASTWEVTRRRWQMTLQKGSMAGREYIIPNAWHMFLEKPILGWAPGQNLVELGAREGMERRDTHNLYLLVLTEDGLVGSIPYFIALWLCLRSAWRARNLEFGLVPLALLVVVLVANLSLTWQWRKLQWLVFGLALASTGPILKRRLPPRVARLPELRPQASWNERRPAGAGGRV